MSALAWSLVSAQSKIRKSLAVTGLILRDKTSLYPRVVTRFERDFARRIGVKHAATFSNGTTAIEAAIFSLGLEPGDEVLAPSYTIHSTFSAALALGIRVKFVDIDPKTMVIDLGHAEALITDRTKAIMPVHIWGGCCDMDRLMELSRAHNLRVVEDCSHCHGGTWKGKALGSFGDIGVFSLQGGKAIAAGEGGIAVTNDPELMDRMLAYGHQGRRVSGTLTEAIETDYLPLTGFGRKARAHPFGIAVAAIDLKTLDRRNALMRTQWTYLQASVGGAQNLSIQSVPPELTMGGFYMGAALQVAQDSDFCDQIYGRLKKRKIKVARRNHAPYHRLPHLYDLDYRSAHILNHQATPSDAPMLPHTEHALTNTLLLPLRQFASRQTRKRWEALVTEIG